MKIKRWIACAEAALAMFTLSVFGQNASTGPDPNTGSYLLHSCKASVRVDDASDPSEVSENDLYDNQFCMAYIMGFRDGNALHSKSEAPLFCVDANATMRVVARLYVQFMTKHPKLLDDDKAYGLTLMLMSNYPCSKSSHK